MKVLILSLLVLCLLIGCGEEEKDYEIIDITYDGLNEWVVDKNETKTKYIELSSFEYFDFEELESLRRLAIKYPEDWKDEISDVIILSVEEKYPCIFNCPNNDSLDRCEYGDCYRDIPIENIIVEDNTIKNRDEKTLRIGVRYRYVRWEYW